jgi:adenine phosphoribosyltransferase
VGCAGFEARGFIFGAPVALELQTAFVPLRKPGKLPGKTIGEKYSLEYGKDEIEMHVGAVKAGQRVLLIDDLIASGGTMAAGLHLMGMYCSFVWKVSMLNSLKALCGSIHTEKNKVAVFTFLVWARGCPKHAIETPRFAGTVVFPTPPLPDMYRMI